MSRLFNDSYSPPVHAAHLYEVCLSLRRRNVPKTLVRQICEGFLFTAADYVVQFMMKIDIFDRLAPDDYAAQVIFCRSDHVEHNPFLGTVGRVVVGMDGAVHMEWPMSFGNPLPGVGLHGQFLMVEEFNSFEIRVISLAMQKFPWIADDPAHYFFTGPSYIDHVGNNNLRFVASYFAAHTGSGELALSHFDSFERPPLPYLEAVALAVLEDINYMDIFNYTWLGRTNNMAMLWSILKRLHDRVLLSRFKLILQDAWATSCISEESMLVDRMKMILDRFEILDPGVDNATLFREVELADQRYLKREDERIAALHRRIAKQRKGVEEQREFLDERMQRITKARLYTTGAVV